MTCSRCGTPLPPGGAFCVECGQRVEPASPSTPSPGEQTGGLGDHVPPAGGVSATYLPSSQAGAGSPQTTPAIAGNYTLPPQPGSFVPPAPQQQAGGYMPPPAPYQPPALYGAGAPPPPQYPYGPPMPQYLGMSVVPLASGAGRGKPALMWSGVGLMIFSLFMLLCFALVGVYGITASNDTPSEIRSGQLGLVICTLGVLFFLLVPGGILFFVGRRR